MELEMNYSSTSAASLFAAFALTASASAAPQAENRSTPSRQIAKQSVCAPWVDAQIACINELQANWDSYDADPLQVKTVSQLRSLLSESFQASGVPGQLVPGADGSIQAEWHLAQASIGLLVEDDGTYSSWIRFNDTEKQIEEFGAAGLDLFKALVSQYRLNV